MAEAPENVHVENDMNIEAGWAIKAAMHAESYYKTIKTSIDPRMVRLSKIDDALYYDFRQAFPKMDIRLLNEEEIKNPEGKEKWRTFMMHYKDIIEDFSFGSLLRKDVDQEYSPENSILVPRTQFLCIELARNREGLNKPGNGEEEPASQSQTIRLPRREGQDSDSERESDLERESKTPAIRLANATRLKAAGNEYFKKSNLKRAIRRYKKAWKEINDMTYLTDEQIVTLKELQTSVNSNLALCLIKTEDYHGALKACDDVLDADDKNVKALFRKGQANLKLGRYEEAQADLVAAAKLDPANAEIRKELEVLKKEIAEKKTREKQMFSKLFKASPAHATTPAITPTGPISTAPPEDQKEVPLQPPKQQQEEETPKPQPQQQPRPKPARAYLEELPSEE